MSFFVPVNFDVIRLRASQGDSSREHVRWEITFDRELLDGDDGIRVVIGSLHGGSAGGWADISVGSFFTNSEVGDDADVAVQIAESEAADSLYDFARSHLQPLLALVGSDLSLPRVSPDAIVNPFEFEATDEEVANSSSSLTELPE